MEPDNLTEAAQFAEKLHQAVLRLTPTWEPCTRQVHKMARSLALAEALMSRNGSSAVVPADRTA